MSERKYYIEDGNFFIRKDILKTQMMELDEEEFMIWFENVLEEARRDSNEY